MLTTYAERLEHFATDEAGPEPLTAVLSGLEGDLREHARAITGTGLLDEQERAVASHDRRHAAIGRALSAVRREAARLSRDAETRQAVAELRRRAGGLAGALRRLAAGETELVLDAAYADYGAGD